MQKTLLMCYGNPSRLDDGLGPAVAEVFEGKKLDNVTVDADYQLNIEYASTISNFDRVVFIDAAVEGREPFYLKKIEPREDGSFTTHSVSPEALMHLSNACFDSTAQGYVLGIRGYDFDDFGEYLSERAKENLEVASDYLEKTIRGGRFEEALIE